MDTAEVPAACIVEVAARVAAADAEVLAAGAAVAAGDGASAEEELLGGQVLPSCSSEQLGLAAGVAVVC